MFGSHCLKSWSVTQTVISLSYGEAEYYAMVKGGSVALGFQAMYGELGQDVKIEVCCDASAAVGMVMRRGLGKLRHIDVTQLWLQEKVASGKIRVRKVGTKDNISDVLTKGVCSQDMNKAMIAVGHM